MPFGPFLSQEEKNKINSAYQTNYGSTPAPVQPPRNSRGNQGGSRASATNRPSRPQQPQQQSTRSGLRGRGGNLPQIETATISTSRRSRAAVKTKSQNSSQPPVTPVKPKVKPKPEAVPENPQAVGADYTVAGVLYDGKTHRPKNAPKGGYSLNLDSKVTPHSTPTGPVAPTERTNANGLKSYGRDLSSLNIFTKEFTGGYEIADINKAFQSEALPTTKAGEDQGHEAPRTNYSWDSEAETGVWDDEKGALIPPSVPGTTGGKPDNAQDGTSDKPDVAEEVRTIRMRRNSGRGSRRDPRNRGEDADMFGGPEPSDASLTSPMYANSRRNKIRSTFLDHEGSSVQAIAAANAVAGYGKDSDGNARFNVGGKLVYAKDGMQQKAKNAAMMGQDPREFLDMPETPDTKPDTPADTQLSMTDPIKDMTEEQQKKAAELFAKGFVSDIAGKLKDK